jgi:GNAT superfamily N-acetyltransferase
LVLVLQPTTNADLPKVYNIYFQTFNQSPLLEISSSDKRNVGTLSFSKAFFLHTFHLIIERLYNSTRGSPVRALYDKKGDMIPLKIVYNNQIVGFCFIKKHTSKVFEIGIIAIQQTNRGLGLGFQAIECIKQIAKDEGATRVIVRASGAKQAAGFFEKCGFKEIFPENIFLLNINASKEANILTF